MTIEKLDTSTPDLTRQNIERLLELFPECRTEGSREDAPMLDFDLLRQALSDYLVEGPAERYRLDWPGKRQALLTANTPIDKTLRPCREESVDFDTTRNLFIEGDNLDALKLLQETYLGKVKMIYIDPPYNTGKDFVYKDNFARSRDDYEEGSGQRDAAEGRLVANPETNGRFHSVWLDMMYPRLKLARNLLRDDGLLFVSIDEHEDANLRRMLNEVFGEANFAGEFCWNTNHSQQQGLIAIYHERILVYTKGGEGSFGNFHNPEGGEIVAGAMKKISRANPESEFTFPPGIRCDASDGTKFHGTWGDGEQITLVRGSFRVQDGRTLDEMTLSAGWTQKNQMQEFFYGKRPVIDTKGQEVTSFYFTSTGKLKHTKEKSKITPSSVIDKFGTVSQSSAYLVELMEGDFFDKPKPVSILKWLIGLACEPGKPHLVLDFFVGSGTLAEAVYQHNESVAGAEVSFAVVQWPQQLDGDEGTAANALAAGFQNIAQLARERVRRASKRAQLSSNEQERQIDNGFRAFRIDSGNFVDTNVTPKEATQEALLGMVNHIKDDRGEEDLLFGALLRWGVDITLPIEQRELAGRTVWLVDVPEDGSGKGAALIACFAKPDGRGKGGIDTELADAMAELAPLRVLFRDDGFSDDATKENAHSRFKQLAPDTQVRVL